MTCKSRIAFKRNLSKNINSQNIKNIIIYIHCCQKQNWQKSFKLLIDSIINSGLYEFASEIRIGIVNDNGTLIEDPILHDNKFNIVNIGLCKDYERPTLLHMKKSSNTDKNNTIYLYLHTKGIRHFDTKREPYVLRWINNMLDVNVVHWKKAVRKLESFETYGCNLLENVHYSGNFWWATIAHIKKLPNHIDSYYIAPENWVLMNKDNIYCAKDCNIIPYPDWFYDEIMIL